MNIPMTFAASLCFLTLSGCVTASEHAQAVNDAQETDSKLTVAAAQRHIQVGMDGASVIEALGSPNIVSTDDERREVWIYDKVSTSRVYSESRGGFNTLVLGGGLVGSALAGGGLGGSYNSGAGAVSTSQRTLTIIVKFDNNSKVRDFAYRTSSF